MCMHHEGWYRQCTDYLFDVPDCDDPPLLEAFLAQNFGIEVVGHQVCQVEMDSLLDDWHERGLVRPDAAMRERGYLPLGGETEPPAPRAKLPMAQQLAETRTTAIRLSEALVILQGAADPDPLDTTKYKWTHQAIAKFARDALDPGPIAKDIP